ncbi:MAG: hypothetical protein QG606_259 [Patescibacteria group bacterium]|nr:hypothetical protein [Patescibacteria group bacterium]
MRSNAPVERNQKSNTSQGRSAGSSDGSMLKRIGRSGTRVERKNVSALRV